jgi:hypothetical protein
MIRFTCFPLNLFCAAGLNFFVFIENILVILHEWFSSLFCILFVSLSMINEQNLNKNKQKYMGTWKMILDRNAVSAYP